MDGPGDLFLERSRNYLTSEYLPKIRLCVEELDRDDLWWRPNPASNSVGNLLLHLAGNLRQWVVSGVGGRPDVRHRSAEFDADGDEDAAELLQRLEEVVAQTDRVLAGLSASGLLERRAIQGRDVTVLEAVYHAVEHFAMHTGQIAFITKSRTGRDLGFYELRQGVPHPSWRAKGGRG